MDFIEIQAEIDKIAAAYHEHASDLTASEIATTNAKVKELRAMLVAELVKGASPCPGCGNVPHGIFHGEDARRPFEIGCLHCAGLRSLVVKDERVGVTFQARASSRESAVKRWNAGPEQWLPPDDPEAASKRPVATPPASN